MSPRKGTDLPGVRGGGAGSSERGSGDDGWGPHGVRQVRFVKPRAAEILPPEAEVLHHQGTWVSPWLGPVPNVNLLQ